MCGLTEVKCPRAWRGRGRGVLAARPDLLLPSSLLLSNHPTSVPQRWGTGERRRRTQGLEKEEKRRCCGKDLARNRQQNPRAQGRGLRPRRTKQGKELKGRALSVQGTSGPVPTPHPGLALYLGVVLLSQVGALHPLGCETSHRPGPVADCACAQRRRCGSGQVVFWRPRKHWVERPTLALGLISLAGKREGSAACGPGQRRSVAARLWGRDSCRVPLLQLEGTTHLDGPTHSRKHNGFADRGG